MPVDLIALTEGILDRYFEPLMLTCRKICVLLEVRGQRYWMSMPSLIEVSVVSGNCYFFHETKTDKLGQFGFSDLHIRQQFLKMNQLSMSHQGKQLTVFADNKIQALKIRSFKIFYSPLQT